MLANLMRSLATSAIVTGLIFGGTAIAAEFKACQVTDTGGIDDKGFNQTAWKGVQDAVPELGVEAKLPRVAGRDRLRDEHQLLHRRASATSSSPSASCSATRPRRRPRPTRAPEVLDRRLSPMTRRSRTSLGQVFATDEAAFLAGYLAAGVSKTGIVGTFGGINIPPVTIFMDGFHRGVAATTTSRRAPTSRCSAGTRPRRKGCSPTTSASSMTAGPSPRTS